MARTKKTKIGVKNTEPQYKASVKILGRVYEATGSSIKEAISNLKPLGTCRGVSLLQISKGGVTKEKILPSIFTMRLFSPAKIVREIALKNTSQLFNL